MTPTRPEVFERRTPTVCIGCGQRLFAVRCSDGGVRWVATYTGRMRCAQPVPPKTKSRNPAKRGQVDWGHRAPGREREMTPLLIP
jgi:hypothetical protein